MDHLSAKPKKADGTDAPAQVPMTAGIKPVDRKRPTGDQKRVRREMARKAGAGMSLPGISCQACAAPVTATASCCGRCGCTMRQASYGSAEMDHILCNNCHRLVYKHTKEPWSQVFSKHAAECPAKDQSLVHAKVATVQQMNVATADGRMLINPGDSIRTPTGQTMKVNNVRRHESSSQHYYLDTDQGTTVVPYSTNFEVVTGNNRQQELPGYGVPGGTANTLPFGGGPQNQGQNPQVSNQPAGGQAASTCPNCGARGSMGRQGDKFRCANCGFTENYQGGQAYSDSTQRLVSPRSLPSPTMNRRSSLASVTATLHDTRSAIARRAAAVLDDIKETP